MSKSNTKTVTKKKGGWPKIGTLRKSEDGSMYIVFNEDVKIKVGDEVVEFGPKRYGNLVDIVEDTKRLIANGIISEDKAEERLAKAEKNSEWLVGEIVVPPPRKD